MRKVLAVLIIGVLLSACVSSNPSIDSGTRSAKGNPNIEYEVFGFGGFVNCIKFVDLDSGIVCYVIPEGGISCLAVQ